MTAALRSTLAGAVALGAAFAAAPAFADIQDFTVRNYSGEYVHYIHVSPNYSENWEEDVLGSDVLSPGDTLFIKMHGYGDHCMFDVRIEDSNGRSQEYWGVDLCREYFVDFYG